MSFWKHREPEFEEAKFIEFLDGIILGKMESVMADLSKLQADVDAQAALIVSVKSKIESQAARIVDLEAQLATHASSDPQAPIDAIDAMVETNNAALTTAAS